MTLSRQSFHEKIHITPTEMVGGKDECSPRTEPEHRSHACIGSGTMSAPNGHCSAHGEAGSGVQTRITTLLLIRANMLVIARPALCQSLAQRKIGHNETSGVGYAPKFIQRRNIRLYLSTFSGGELIHKEFR